MLCSTLGLQLLDLTSRSEGSQDCYMILVSDLVMQGEMAAEWMRVQWSCAFSGPVAHPPHRLSSATCAWAEMSGRTTPKCIDSFNYCQLLAHSRLQGDTFLFEVCSFFTTFCCAFFRIWDHIVAWLGGGNGAFRGRGLWGLDRRGWAHTKTRKHVKKRRATIGRLTRMKDGLVCEVAVSACVRILNCICRRDRSCNAA